MRSTAEAEGSAAPSRARPRTAARRSRSDQDTQPAPQTQTAAPAEPAAVPVAGVRLIRVEEGIYALRIGELGGTPGEVAGLAVPSAHVAAPFAEDGSGVEIVASFPRRGPWLGREGGTLILRAPHGGGFVVVTVYGSPGEAVGELALDLQRLDGPPGANTADTAAGRSVSLTGTRDVPAEILLHIERAGDRLFPGRGWVGALGRRMRIEAFSIRPLEHLAPTDIEMKGFLPNGGETPWIPGGTLCGTRGRGLPLIGFAVRVVPQRADRFEAVYQGSFFNGGISETHRNGDPCRAAGANDPLEAINVRLIERVPEAEGPAPVA